MVECVLLLLLRLFNWRAPAKLGMPNTRMVRKSSHYVFTYNANKAAKVLGLNKPRHEPPAALEKTLEWWRRNWREAIYED